MHPLRKHEIAEAGHRILNPFTDAKLALLGEVCRLEYGQRILDLASGKGELLCTWAARYGVGGLGVDLSEVFTAAAKARAFGGVLGSRGRPRRLCVACGHPGSLRVGRNGTRGDGPGRR